jgi:hypothetical protein
MPLDRQRQIARVLSVTLFGRPCPSTRRLESSTLKRSCPERCTAHWVDRERGGSAVAPMSCLSWYEVRFFALLRTRMVGHHSDRP